MVNPRSIVQRLRVSCSQVRMKIGNLDTIRDTVPLKFASKVHPSSAEVFLVGFDARKPSRKTPSVLDT